MLYSRGARDVVSVEDEAGSAQVSGAVRDDNCRGPHGKEYAPVLGGRVPYDLHPRQFRPEPHIPQTRVRDGGMEVSKGVNQQEWREGSAHPTCWL